MCNWEWQQRTSSHQRWKKDEPSQWHGIRNCEQSPAESSSSNNGNNPTGKLWRPSERAAAHHPMFAPFGALKLKEEVLTLILTGWHPG